MANTLGKHLLIDFYNCKAELTTSDELQNLVKKAFEPVGMPIEGITLYHDDAEELVCIGVSKNAHLCIHIYPHLAYVAVDIYSFNNDLNASHVMSTLKVILGSDRIKATSIRRGDFGSLRDMRPTRKSKITTVRRMKNTGSRIKKTSARMFNILRHPQKMRRSRRIKKK